MTPCHQSEEEEEGTGLVIYSRLKKLFTKKKIFGYWARSFTWYSITAKPESDAIKQKTSWFRIGQWLTTTTTGLNDWPLVNDQVFGVMSQKKKKKGQVW